MENIFNNVYKNKRVLITGHTGFKGSWLSLWLHELGAKVAGYSLNPPTNPNMFDELRLEGKIKHIIGDVRNHENLNKAFQEFNPEIVFHLAAQPLVRYSYLAPRDTYETNVLGTVNVLEEIRLSKSVLAGIIITTDKCYENKEWVYGYRENDPMGGYDPYSSSKGCAELVTSAYRSSFFNPVNYGKNHKTALASVRAGNVIGGGDWAEDRLVPDCVRSLIKKESIIIRNPHATRPWQHVLEPLSGYLSLGAKMLNDGMTYSKAWNFGPKDEDVLTVENVVNTVTQCWGQGNYQIQPDNKFHEANLLKLDISNAYFNLKWQPVYKALTALQYTVGWYKNYYSEQKSDIYNFTLTQIKEYVAQAKELKIEWSSN